MSIPTCPSDYNCDFTLVHPRVIYHDIGPWWQHTAGWIVAIVVAILIACLVAYVVSLVHEIHKDKQGSLERERERQNKMTLKEQRTMQLDAAKGNPEMLKIVRDMQRG